MALLTFKEYRENNAGCAHCRVKEADRSLQEDECALCYGFYVEEFKARHYGADE